MKLTKRILTCAMAVILVAAMALSFTACGGDKAVEDVKKVKDAGKIIVGITEYAPMDYKDENGEWTGFDAEFARLFAEELGVECEFFVISDWGKKFLLLSNSLKSTGTTRSSKFSPARLTVSGTV